MTEAKQANAVTEQQVFDFLATHPDFLERHPKLLSHITISHQVEGGVSLVERQVKVLREDNEQLLEKCIRLVLCLIDCQSLQQLTNTLNDLLKREFDLDLVSINLVGRWPRHDNARVYSDAKGLLQSLDCQFPDNQPICGRIDKKTRSVLFPSTSEAPGSVAILPLGHSGNMGILALLSHDATRFSPEMGDLFLQLISSVTSQMLQKFKDF